MITLADAKTLIGLARSAISCEFSGTRVSIPEDIARQFSAHQGVFVTLKIKGELRGCIGYAEPVYPLATAVVKAGFAAAFEDPRFPPLSEDEYEEILVEISVLSVPELICVQKPEEYISRIVIGRDGLIIKGSGASGLLLPQVFSEYQCSPEQALEFTCKKAGLARNAWQDLRNKMYSFQAQVFQEADGTVKPVVTEGIGI